MSTELDSAQILPLIYDSTNNAIQVEVVGGGGSGTTVNISGVTPVSGALPVLTENSFVTVPYNEVDLTYVPSGNGVGQIATAIYKLSSTTVATLTFTYNSSNQLTSVVKS